MGNKLNYNSYNIPPKTLLYSKKNRFMEELIKMKLDQEFMKSGSKDDFDLDELDLDFLNTDLGHGKTSFPTNLPLIKNSSINSNQSKNSNLSNHSNTFRSNKGVTIMKNEKNDKLKQSLEKTPIIYKRQKKARNTVSHNYRTKSIKILKDLKELREMKDHKENLSNNNIKDFKSNLTVKSLETKREISEIKEDKEEVLNHLDTESTSKRVTRGFKFKKSALSFGLKNSLDSSAYKPSGSKTTRLINKVSDSFQTKAELENEKAKALVNKNEIDNYSLLKVIGKGSYGKVVLAKQRKNSEFYAIKMIKKEFLKGKELDNLKTEKRILEKLSHPFIVKLHKTFQSPEIVYFAFPYYTGGDLFHHLLKHKHFNENQARYFAAQLYLALTHLHENNILYRDLKPENVMLDKFGNVKLVDFGLSKENVTMLKYTSTICGTREYLPPEAVKGQSYGLSFDWWSYGILIFEMLNGFPPFADNDQSKLYKKIIHADPEFGVKASDDCKDLVNRLLKKNINMRISPSEIVSHPWFKSINFEDTMKLKTKSPYIPKVKNTGDCSNIDKTFLSMNVNSPLRKNKVVIENPEAFEEF